MTAHSKINFGQLIIEIRAMNPRRKLFQVLKTELTKIGRWHRNHGGNPAKGYAVMIERKNQRNPNDDDTPS